MFTGHIYINEMIEVALGLMAQHQAVLPQTRLRAASAQGLRIAAPRPPVPLGTRLHLPDGAIAEIVAIGAEDATALPFQATRPRVGDTLGVLPPGGLAVGQDWLGRVVDPLGAPLDGGKRPAGTSPRDPRAAPPAAGTRGRLGAPIGLGVRALDLFCTLREGQRIGLFAASGIGKSSLLAMLAGAPGFDVIVLGLIGERGRELREFIEDDLGPERLARCVVVCATSDMAAPMRREAAFAAMAAAEHFRDAGQRVLLLLDSVTRFALACREIGLAAGEPPATRGHPPSTFAELPRLLERAGPGPDGCAGSITLLATVLVEGDDHDEPIADAVRGILDGHVVLDRAIAEAGRYPAIDVARSVSRSVPGCLTPERAALARRARRILAIEAEMADLLRLGAYRAGADAAVDEALRLAPRIEALLRQGRCETTGLDAAFAQLSEAVDGEA